MCALMQAAEFTISNLERMDETKISILIIRLK